MKFTNLRMALRAVFLASALLGQEAESISFVEHRPLAKIAHQLVIRYHQLINYEEAPYGQEDLRTEEPVPGLRLIGPAYKPMKFFLHSRSEQTVAGSDGRNQRTSPMSELVPRLVKEYNESGNPGRFAAFVEGEYSYIVPSARVVKGREERIEPILGVKVS